MNRFNINIVIFVIIFTLLNSNVIADDRPGLRIVQNDQLILNTTLNFGEIVANYGIAPKTVILRNTSSEIIYIKHVKSVNDNFLDFKSTGFFAEPNVTFSIEPKQDRKLTIYYSNALDKDEVDRLEFIVAYSDNYDNEIKIVIKAKILKHIHKNNENRIYINDRDRLVESKSINYNLPIGESLTNEIKIQSYRSDDNIILKMTTCSDKYFTLQSQIQNDYYYNMPLSFHAIDSGAENVDRCKYILQNKDNKTVTIFCSVDIISSNTSKSKINVKQIVLFVFILFGLFILFRLLYIYSKKIKLWFYKIRKWFRRKRPNTNNQEGPAPSSLIETKQFINTIKEHFQFKDKPNDQFIQYLAEKNYQTETDFINTVYRKVFKSRKVPVTIDEFAEKLRSEINSHKNCQQKVKTLNEYIDKIGSLFMIDDASASEKMQIIENQITLMVQHEAYLPFFIKSTEELLFEIHNYLQELIREVNPDLPFKIECIDPIIGDLRGVKKAINIIGSKNNRQNLFEALNITQLTIINTEKLVFFNEFIQPFVSFVLNGICRLYLYRKIKMIDVSGVDFFNKHKINVELIDEMFFCIKTRFKSLFDIDFILPQLCHDVFDEKIHSDKHTKSSFIKNGFYNVIDRIEQHVIYDLISPGIQSVELNIPKTNPEVIYKIS